MGKYSQFSADYHYAEGFHSNATCSKYPGLFLKSFEAFCDKICLDYNINYGADSVCITSKTFQIDLTLNENRQIERAVVQGMGELVKGIRDSIWDTKTFFGVPVFMVMNTCFFDDELMWEDFPHQFMVVMITKEML